MCKVTRKLDPLIDFKQKLSDFEVGHERESFVLELLCFLGHRLLEWTYLEQFTRNLGIRQFTIARELIDLVQLLFQECKTRSQVAFAVNVDCHRRAPTAGLPAGLPR